MAFSGQRRTDPVSGQLRAVFRPMMVIVFGLCMSVTALCLDALIKPGLTFLIAQSRGNEKVFSRVVVHLPERDGCGIRDLRIVIVEHPGQRWNEPRVLRQSRGENRSDAHIRVLCPSCLLLISLAARSSLPIVPSAADRLHRGYMRALWPGLAASVSMDHARISIGSKLCPANAPASR